MKNLILKNWREKILTKLNPDNIVRNYLIPLPFLINTFPANAGNSDLPFTSTMSLLKEAISGPFLLSAAIILIVITCLMLAFGEWGDGFKRLINIVLWLSIAFAATGFVTTMFGNGAGI